MRKTIYTLLFAATMFSAVSCLVDKPVEDGPGTDGAEIVLRLRTSGGFTAPRTRADFSAEITYEEETAIGDVYVLVFDNDSPSKLVAVEKAENVVDYGWTSPQGGYSNAGSFTVTLPPSRGVAANATFNLVALANAGKILQDCGFMDIDDLETPSGLIGYDYDYVTSYIYQLFNSRLYSQQEEFQTIPMWGETGQIQIGPSTQPTIELMRAVARIDVGLGDAPIHWKGDIRPIWDGLDADGNRIPFMLWNVYVMRPMRKYAIIPDVAGLAAGNPTIPENTDSWTPSESGDDMGFGANDNYITRQIYVPEADIKMGGTPGDANHTERMAIIVGGQYDANGDGQFDRMDAFTYYRLDFVQDGQLINVLRNHVYQFNIQSVSGHGYTSMIEAYEANPINMTCNIVDWDYDDLNGTSAFEGVHKLTISRDELTFGRRGGTQTIDVITDYPGGWSATLHDEQGNILTYPWLSADPSSGTGEVLNITAELYDGYHADRTAWVHITAGRMVLKIEVTQEKAPEPGVRAPAGVIGYYAEDGPGGRKKGDLTLEGDKSWQDDPSISPTSSTVRS